METILVIEDDEGLNRGIAFALSKEGFRVLTAHNLAAGRKIFQEAFADLVLLDLNLPDGDGLDLCREIREHSGLPVIMLTARDLETDEVIGFETGADDYITKPFSLSVLKARVSARLRKSGGHTDLSAVAGNRWVISDNIRLCRDTMKVYRDEQEIPLSVTEYKLLLLFLEHAGQVLLKEQILSAVWDIDANFVDENTLSVNIRRLRMKLERNPSHPRLIKTVHGMGYIWDEGESNDR